MAEVKFFKESTLPASPVANAWYMIINGDYAETYITNSSGVAKMVGNSVMINQLIATQLSSLSQTYIVANIAARNTLTATLTSNSIIQVVDATGDATVGTGGATYLWDNANHISIKVSEFESLDAVVQWTTVVGRPSSTPGQIDSAVTDSHTHSNKTLLDLLTDVGGNLAYNGTEVKGWNTVNW